jgi:carboxy-terminal domain RNA polymerase II polypeptide A small phosphatase
MIEKSNKLLILDLDETLIHATENELDIPYDFIFDRFYIYKRPFLVQFLEEICKHFSVAIWSSADDIYVNEIVRQITPTDCDYLFVWGNSKCTQKRDYDLDVYYYEKRLDKIKSKGYKLEHILIVDDSPEKSRNNYGNAIYIDEFLGDQNDIELNQLSVYVQTLKTAENLRRIEKRGWRK